MRDVEAHLDGHHSLCDHERSMARDEARAAVHDTVDYLTGSQNDLDGAGDADHQYRDHNRPHAVKEWVGGMTGSQSSDKCQDDAERYKRSGYFGAFPGPNARADDESYPAQE